MTVTALLQDKKGYIYIGTYDGLVRFDGVEFTVINRSVSEKYDFASVHALFQDSEENLWVGHNDEGITRLTPNGDVAKYTREDGIPNNKINAICEDKDKNIWVGTATGLCYIAPTSEVVIPPALAEKNIHVSNLLCDSDGKIWICTGFENELFVFSDGKLKKFSGFQETKVQSVHTVAQDKDGALWFGATPHYAVRLKDGEETVFDLSHEGKRGTVVNEIMFDSDGSIWCGSDFGLTILHNGMETHYDTANGLSDNGITAVLEDTEGNIWIGLNRGGLMKMTQGKFTTVHLGFSVNSVCEDKSRGVTWLGTDTGVLCYNGKEFVENTLTKRYKGTRVRHVTRTEDGEILVAAFSTSIPFCIMSQDDSIRTWAVSDGISVNRCRVALKSSSGDYYAGTASGLSIIRRDGTVSTLTKDAGLTNDYIMWLYEDAKNQIWVGTNGGGIFVLKDENIVKSYTTQDGLAGNVIFKIEMVGSNLWIGTGTGISKYDEENDSFTNFNSRNGLGTDSVFQLLLDKNETAWILTNKGILSADMRDMESVAQKKTERVPVQYYTSSDGLVTGGATSTAFSQIDSTGRLWFTLVDGFAIYDPNKTLKGKIPPKIEIESYAIDNNIYEYHGEKIVIPPRAKRFSIKYTGLSFVAPEKVIFSSRLQNFEDDFSEWANMRIGSYTNLKPGLYYFSVKAKSREGIESEPSTPVAILKRAHIYQHIWFWIALVIAAVALSFFTIRLKIRAVQRKASENRDFMNKIIGAFANCVDGKDEYTNGHSIRVAKYTKMLAKKLGESDATIEQFYNIALLHDIGKISIPDAILKKPGRLDDEEFAIMKSHAQRGYEILKDVNIQEDLAAGAHYHHERFDGKGYPEGLSAQAIPWVARIIAVADTFDAMSSTRPYRKKLPLDYIVEEIKRCSGTQLDPKVVEKFLELYDEGTFDDLR